MNIVQLNKKFFKHLNCNFWNVSALNPSTKQAHQNKMKTNFEEKKKKCISMCTTSTTVRILDFKLMETE